MLWAHVFGLGGYYLTSAFKRIEGPFAFAAFVVVALGLVHFSRYLKANEKRLLAEADAAIAVKSAKGAYLALSATSKPRLGGVERPPVS